MKEGLNSPETSVLKRATHRNFPEDAFLHSHRRDNLKPYRDLSTFSELTNDTNFVAAEINIGVLSGS
jgi:hypothetical protein